MGAMVRLNGGLPGALGWGENLFGKQMKANEANEDAQSLILAEKR